MKLQIRALSATLILASLVGACSSVNSSTPSVENPSVNTSLELDSSGQVEGLGEVPTESTDMETAGFETLEKPAAESTDMENSNFSSSEETANELESADEGLKTGLDSTGMENPQLESLEQSAPEIESSEAPIESPGSELILPVEDAQTTTESEAADNSNLEPAQ